MVKQLPPLTQIRVPAGRRRGDAPSLSPKRPLPSKPTKKAAGGPAGGGAAARTGNGAADAAARRKQPAAPTSPVSARRGGAARGIRTGIPAAVFPQRSSRSSSDSGSGRSNSRLRPAQPRTDSSTGAPTVQQRTASQAPPQPHSAAKATSTVITMSLSPHRASWNVGATPSVVDGLADEDALLLCGLQPGSSKALWYTTMRAQLESRAQLRGFTESDADEVAKVLVGRPKSAPTPASGSSTSPSQSANSRADGGAEPLVLPTELLLLTEPSDLNAFLTAHTRGVSVKVRRFVPPPPPPPPPPARPAQRAPSTSSGDATSDEDDTEDTTEDATDSSEAYGDTDGEEEDEDEEGEEDEESSIGNHSSRSGSGKGGETAVWPDEGAMAPPRPNLKLLRPTSLQLQQTRVAVLSLQGLLDDS